MKSCNTKQLLIYAIHLPPPNYALYCDVQSNSFAMISQTINSILINTALPHHLTSQHLRQLLHHNKSYCHHQTTILRYLRVSQCLHFSITPLASCFPHNHLLLSLVNSSHDSYHYHYHNNTI
jgi:hypothetical protein